MKVLTVTTIDITVWTFLIPHLKALQREGFEVEVACAGGKFFRDIAKEGIKVNFIPFSRRFYHPSNILAFLKMLKLLRQNKYNILHTHTPVASLISRIAAKIVNVPFVIYTVYEFPFHEYGSKLGNLCYYVLEKIGGIFTDVFITINSDDYRAARKLFPDIKVYYIKGVGVDSQKYSLDNVNLQECLKLKNEFNIDKEKIVVVIS